MNSHLLDTPTKHPWSVTALADHAWNIACERAIKTGWKPVAHFAEAYIVRIMQNITYGHLRILTSSRIYNFPETSGKQDDDDHPDLRAEIRVVNDTFWIRLLTTGDLGFAEAYMYGDVECDDLVATFEMIARNDKTLSDLSSKVPYLSRALTSFRFLGTIANSRSNISAHYDISNEMFAGFLSEDMTYSSGIFDNLDDDLDTCGVPRDTWSDGQGMEGPGCTPRHVPTSTIPATPDADPLHTAQIRKLHRIIAKADIRTGHRVLEIGSGWGSFAIEAVRLTGCEVDTITLSVHQQTLAQARIRAAGLEDKIRVHLMDYRCMPPNWESAFDRFVSIEMMEHVGRKFFETYWGVVDWALKKKDAVGVVQVITIAESLFDQYVSDMDFMRKWVLFPGGFLPTPTLLLTSMNGGAHNRFIVESVENIGLHYVRTLREWRRRFLARFDTVIIPALQREYPEVMTGPHGFKEIQVFKRKWIYYYCYCEVGFSTRKLGDYIIAFAREGNTQYGRKGICN